MNLSSFLATPSSKYIVVGKSVWEQDVVAMGIAPTPREFTINETTYVILSLDPLTIPQLEAYMVSQGGEYEFGFTQGNGKASFLTHEEALGLLKEV